MFPNFKYLENKRFLRPESAHSRIAIYIYIYVAFGVRFSLYVIDINSNYAWTILYSVKRQKKFIRITNAFQNFLGKVGCKPNNIWVDHGSEFYDGSLKQWLH